MGKHKPIGIVHTFSLAILVMVFGASWASAQGTKPRTPNPFVPRPVEKSDKTEKNVEKGEVGDVIRIRKFVGTGRQIIEKTPEYKTSVARGVKPAGDWAQIILTYDTAPEWIDELTMQFYVLTQKVEEGKKTYSFFKTTVKYIDIEKGREHLSTVYLRPSTLKRYGAVVAAAVEISSAGKVISEKWDSEAGEIGKLQDKWWTDPKVVERKDVTVRDGYLIDRAQTPFAFVNVDDYEVSK